MCDNVYCKVPTDTPLPLENLSKSRTKPVGVLLDPELIGDSRTCDKENLRFYPCSVKKPDLSGNWSKIAPDCKFETTYQYDFIFRGKDRRRGRTYEFHGNEDKFEMYFCSPPPPVPQPSYGRRRTDLKPSVKKMKKGPGGAPEPESEATGPQLQSRAQEAKMRVSEYMDSVSKLGNEMIAYSLLKKAADQHNKIKRG